VPTTFLVCLWLLAAPLLAKSPAAQRPLARPLDDLLVDGSRYFVDPASGADSNDGSVAEPWRTMQFAVGRLDPGDTLYLRGGVYFETVYLTRSGTAESPITISAYPGELPILDGGLREFLESPETSWQPLEGSVDEFVSTQTYVDAVDRQIPHQFLPGAWEPMWGIEEHRPIAMGHFADSLVPLHGYRTAADLRSTNEYQPQKDTGTLYCGPGLWFNRVTNRIHIRLAHHTLPGLDDRAYGGEVDPRKLPLCVAAGFGRDVLRINGIRHIGIRGLVLRGATGSPMIHLYGSQDIQLDHLTVYGGFPGLLINASQGISVTHSAFRGLAAPWSGRSHMKYRGTPSYQVVLHNGQPFNEDLELAHCEFTEDHDFAFFRYAKNLRFHHNFVDNFNDDGLECGPKLRWHSIFIHHNRIGACLGVLQQHELYPDESPATHDPNSGVYVYRNVFDQRAGVYYGLPREPDPSGAFLHDEGHLLSDHGSPTYPVMRVYQNTFLRRQPVWRNYFLFGLGGRELRDTERDVFNNIFVQINGTPGAVIHGKVAGSMREGGNLLWGVNREANNAPLFEKLRKSPLFVDSQRFYKPGWSTHDKAADPKFFRLLNANETSDLRLSADSPAINAGQGLPANWPDPLRDADEGTPDIGALPQGVEPWRVGVEGRIRLFSGTQPRTIEKR
jgi:hypothetical protein